MALFPAAVMKQRTAFFSFIHLQVLNRTAGRHPGALPSRLGKTAYFL